MREGWFFREGKFTIAATLIAAVAAISCGILSAEAASTQPRDSEKILSPDYLSGEQAQQYLDKLKLGTADRIASTRKLLLRGRGSDFAKAAVLLDVVDSKDEYVIAKLGDADKVIPPVNKIAEEMGGISIGTFSEPPKGKADRAIIDTHRKLKIVVLPAKRIDDLVKAIGRLSSRPVKPASATAETAAKPAETQKTSPKPSGPADKIKAAPPVNPKTTSATKPAQPVTAKAVLEQAAARIKQQDAQADAEEPAKAAAAGKPRPANGHKETSAIPDDLKATIDRMLGRDAESQAAQAAEATVEEPATKPRQPVKTAVEQPKTIAEQPQKVADVRRPEPAKTVLAEEPTKAEVLGKPTPAGMPAGLQEAINKMLAQDKAQPADQTVSTAAQQATADIEATKTGRPNKSEMAPDDSEDRGTVTVELDSQSGDETPNGAGEVSYKTPEIANGEDPLKMTLPETMSIEQLLALAGEYLHMDYMYEPQDVKAMVTLKLQGKLRGQLQVKDLYPLLESVLKFKGLVMTRTGNVVSIVPLAKVGEVDPELIIESGQVRHGDVVITRVFTLDHIDTASALNLLTTMKLGVSISQIPENQKLIVTGYTYRMPRIERLLNMIDRPGKPREFRWRVLRYTMAQNLAPTISALAEQLGTVSVSVSVSATAPTSSPAPPNETAAQRRARLAREAMARTQAARSGQTAPATATTPDTVYLDADERTNRILMIGDSGQLEIVEQLIDTLDVAQADLRQMKTYKITNVDAEEVRRLMGELGVIGVSQTQSSRFTSRNRTMTNRTTGGTTGRPQTTPATATPAQPASPLTTTSGPSGVLVEEPQVVVLEMTNSLLINATNEQHEQLEKIIGYIDQSPDEDEIPYKIYPLENQKPEDLAAVLEQLIQETVKDAEGKVQQVVKRQDEEIVIVPDENTFSLIVYASKKNQEWISNLIEQLDKRRPQVLIDVSLVEITRTDQFEYDLNVIANAKDLVTGNIEVLGANAASIGNHLEGGWNIGNSGEVKGFWGEDKIQAILTAMDKKDYGRILAQPKVLVNDNEQGTIGTTEKTYVKEDTTVYTDQGVPVTSSKWTEYPAKIELNITPNISEGELLRLEIEMTREDFTPKENQPPDYRTSNVNTVVTVPDGATIILGGLTKLKQNKGGSKVPLLGDIPGIGALFRSVANKDEANKLYIFVKATILRPGQSEGLTQLRRVSDENRAAFEEAEEQFQNKEDLPGFKPTPMEPARVLGPRTSMDAKE